MRASGSNLHAATLPARAGAARHPRGTRDTLARPVVIFSGIQPTGRKHLGNYIGAILNYVEGQDRGDPAIYCIVDLHATTVAYDPEELRRRSQDTAALLVAAGLDPERCILFRQGDVPEHTELTLAALERHVASGRSTACTSSATRRARARERASAGLLFYPVLMAADVLAYRAHEVPVGEDQREHIELMRDVAEASTSASARRSSCRRATSRRSARACATSRSPTKKMSTTGGTPKGTVYVDEEPASIVKKFKSAQTDSGREIVCADDKPGITNLIEILAVVRGVDARPTSSASSPTPAATATSSGPWARRSPPGWRPCASATSSCARTPRRSRSSWPRAPRRRSALAAPVVADVRERMGVGALAPVRRPARLGSPPVRIAELELDLDVFAGPFDLLLSLILREELDLLEVDLAEVVVAYLDHLEAADELDLEAATEFLVLIAALLELKSRLMLPGEEVEELDELGPAEAAEELRGADAAVRALPRRRRASGRAPRARPVVPVPLGAAAVRARRGLTGAYDPAVLGAALGGLLRTPPPIDLTHMGDAARDGRPSGSRCCARCCARGIVLVRRGGRRRRPRDGLRDACSRCSSSTSAARPRGSRRSRSGRSPSTPSARRPRHDARRPARGAAVPRARAGLGRGAGGRAADLRGGGRPGRARSSRPTSTAAGSCCAASPAGSRSPRIRTPRRRPGACWPARARRRSRPRRPRRSRSSPTCSRSRAPRWPASAAWPSESATSALVERGLIEEAGRSQFGAVLYRTTPLFLQLFGLDSPEELPDLVAVGPEPRGGRRAARPAAARRRGTSGLNEESEMRNFHGARMLRAGVRKLTLALGAIAALCGITFLGLAQAQQPPPPTFAAYPVPGTLTASERTTISFRGGDAAALGAVTVRARRAATTPAGCSPIPTARA